VADEAVNRIGAILEELGARFDLVVEAVSGFGGRLDTLRDEIFGQFAEVGGQIRFLSEQIAENRRGIAATHDDLGAEMIRLGEALGKTRVEFRDELVATGKVLRAEFSARAIEFREEATRAVASTGQQAADSGTEVAKTLKREIAASAEMAAKKLGAELKQTSKSLANLARKFDRFDDRITVQTRDQDQRLRKLERKRGA
jgi:UDP-N-acetylmuramyl pentapeptide synthase